MVSIVRAWLFIGAMVLSSSAFAVACGTFTDVDDSDYPGVFCTATEWFKNRGITAGCAAGLYCPESPVKRIQMALFMKNLGDVLTTKKLFTDSNPGLVTIQNGAQGFVCSVPHTTPAYPQSAVIHGLAWGLVDAAVVWTADIWYSTDGGATFQFITNFRPSFGAPAAGMTSGSTFAQLNLNPATSYTFAILIRESPDGPNGVGNFTDLACHQMVEIGNGSATPAPPPCDFLPAIPGCNDAAARRATGGSLGRN